MTLVVHCRCGDTHLPLATPVPCAYCATPTFDHHDVCGRCRPLEALEQHADRVLDVMAEIDPP